jgi:hypothetical protein
MRNISAFYHHAAQLVMHNDPQLYCLFHFAPPRRGLKDEDSKVEDVYVNEALDDPDEKWRKVEPFCDLPAPNPKLKLIDAKATKEAAEREEAAQQEEKDQKAREKKIEETRKQKEREAEAARLKAEEAAKLKKEEEERISKASKERARASKNSR